MAVVTWRSLSLVGFGCYRERVTVEFHEGINVLVADNERGKSTLVAGLEAVLFGLPNSKDPEAFGTARYTNWEQASQFEGEVEIKVGDKFYCLKRQFNTNRVVIKARDEKSWKEIWQGTYNPGAHRKNPVYIEHLESMLGITSRELFEAIFCLKQPLPEERQLSTEVQKLLSGSGGHYQEALKDLAAGLKQLTRYTGDRGVGNNGRKDARIEELAREIELLRKQEQETKNVIAELNEVGHQLMQVAAEIKISRNELKEKQEIKTAWERWRTLQQRYSSALREQQQAKTSLDRAEELERKACLVREKILELYPEWVDAGDSAADSLARLYDLEKEMVLLSEELSREEKKLRHIDEQYEVLEGRLHGDLAAVAGNPDILKDLEELQRLKEERKEKAGKLKELVEQSEAAAEKLKTLPDFGLLGNSPATVAEGLRLSAAQLLASWERFKKQQVRRKELEEELEELGCFADLSPADARLVENYDVTRLQLELEEQAAREKYQGISVARSNYLQQKEKYEYEFAELADLDEEAGRAAAEKTLLLEEVREKEQLLEKMYHKSRRKAVVWALIPILLCLGTGFVTGYWIYALIAMFVLSGAGYTAAIRLERSKGEIKLLRRNIATINERLAELNSMLGPWAGAGTAQLGELRQRLWERDRARAELEKAAAALLPEVEEKAAQEALVAAAEEYRKFQEATAAMAARFKDLPAAYRRYRSCREEKERLETEMEAIAINITGKAVVEQHELSELPLQGLDPPWPGLETLARIKGLKPSTAGELLCWLEGLSTSEWDAVLADAALWEDITGLYRHLEEAKARLLQADAAGGTALQRLDRKITELEQHILPFTADSETGAVQAQLEELARIKEQMSKLGGYRQAAAGRAEEIREKIFTLACEAEKLKKELEGVLAAAGDDTSSAVQRRKDYEKLVKEERSFKEQLSGLTGGGDRDSLHTAFLDASNRAGAVLMEWQKLADEHPALPEAGQETGSGELEQQYCKLQADIRELENRLEELDCKERELLRRQSTLEGSQIINIAGVDEILQSKERELNRLAQEADALALAHREITAAAQYYSQSYRQELEKRVSGYFNLFTGNNERLVVINEDFQVEVTERGMPVALSQLSCGTQDQLYLALRLGIADFLSSELTLPFIFDDCFVNCDSERRERIRESLEAISSQRQIILLTHDAGFAAWGKTVEVACV